MVIGTAGAAVALWCILTFAFIGRGTPAPFDPPRRLVIKGPYRFVRNPMYVGAGLALAGAALYYESWPVLVYAGLFLLLTHFFVVLYEEPTLRQTFGPEYEAYCHRVRRWWPSLGEHNSDAVGTQRVRSPTVRKGYSHHDALPDGRASDANLKKRSRTVDFASPRSTYK